MSKRRSARATRESVSLAHGRLPLSWRVGLSVAGALAALFFAQGLFGSLDESLTWDEPIYIASGFSGHGAMHSPIATKAVAEMVALGESKCIDVSPLSIRRFECGGKGIEERAVI